MRKIALALISILVFTFLFPTLAVASTNYLPPYHVSGNTLAEAKAYMDQHGPQDNTGTHYPGITYIDVVPTKQPPGLPKVEPIQEPYFKATITVSVTWEIKADILLPTWDGYSQASAAAQAEWDRYVNCLKDHEDGHVQTAVDALNNMNPPAQTSFSVSGTGLTPAEAIANATAALANIDQQIEQERQRILGAIDTASKKYDNDTAHGATQGATLNTNIESGTPEERIAGLIDDLIMISASDGVSSALESTLQNALKSLQNGNNRAATGQLNAFINQVQATAGKKNGPTTDEATELVSEAQSIRAQIGHN